MAFTSDQVAAQQVQECLNSLYSLIHSIEEKRQLSEQGTSAITKYQEEKGQVQLSQVKVKNLYKTALNCAEQEEMLLRDALNKIAEIRNIKNERRIKSRMAGNRETIRKAPWMKMLQSNAQTLPLYIGKLGEKPPPLCGAVPPEPNYIAKVGDMVAAFVQMKVGPNWMLAEVVTYSHENHKYEVDDILEEQNERKRYTTTKKNVVPLPLMRANPDTDPSAFFPEGTIALYPQTSCLYPAIVCKVPQTHIDDYEVIFYDEGMPGGFSSPMAVHQRYMTAMKQKNKI